MGRCWHVGVPVAVLGPEIANGWTLSIGFCETEFPEDFVLVGPCPPVEDDLRGVPTDRLGPTVLSTMTVYALCDRGSTGPRSQRVPYMATIIAIRTFYTRLVVRGKPQKVALVVVMHALLTFLNAVM